MPLQIQPPSQNVKTSKTKKTSTRAAPAPYDPHFVEPSKQNQLRFQYNHGETNRLPNVKKPHYVVNAESKIKDHVAFFKDM